MGACQCNGHDLENELKENKIFPTPPPRRSRISSSSPTKDVVVQSTDPIQQFATPVENFPSLSQPMKETKQRLVDFNLEHEDQVEGQYVDKTFKLKNGIFYKGEWKDGRIHGKGKFYLPDNSYLQCLTKNNKPFGKCLMIKENGNYYDGQIKQYMANGKGKLSQGNILYEGQFFNNVPHGVGNQYGPNYQFVGNYEFGSKFMGKLTWKLDTSHPWVYVGKFHDQKFNGRGTLVNDRGTFEGLFIDNQKSGHGTFYYKNGSRFEGTYNKNKKNGEGKMFNSEGMKVLQGKWVDDKPPN